MMIMYIFRRCRFGEKRSINVHFVPFRCVFCNFVSSKRTRRLIIIMIKAKRDAVAVEKKHRCRSNFKPTLIHTYIIVLIIIDTRIHNMHRDMHNDDDNG